MRIFEAPCGDNYRQYIVVAETPELAAQMLTHCFVLRHGKYEPVTATDLIEIDLDKPAVYEFGGYY